jgi:hypothetical protein
VSSVSLDLAPGLWIWRIPHPDWRPEFDWPELITSTCVESGGEVALLDPLAPPEGSEVWERLDAKPPTMVVVLKPDHVRDIDLFVQRYDARAFGPWLFFAGDAPKTRLEEIEPDMELPGGLRTLFDARWRNETPLWLPEQKTLVFADALTAPEGELRIWGTRQLDRARAVFREHLELPFERVIVSHGEPVHDRAAYERALELPPYG